jgi:hypothetical protein
VAKKTVKLWCKNGAHHWERPQKRGQRPHNCPQHSDSNMQTISQPRGITTKTPTALKPRPTRVGPNPFVVKLGYTEPRAPKTPPAKPRTNPFSPPVNGRTPPPTKRERKKALRTAEQAQTPQIKNPRNPWVAKAHDLGRQRAELEQRMAAAQAQYEESLTAAFKANNITDINKAFNTSDRLMNAVIALAAQQRRLGG